MSRGNPHRGEVYVEIAGQEMRLRYDWDAVARLKAQFGEAFELRVADAIRTWDVDTLAELLSIGLRHDHPEATPDAIKAASPPLGPCQQAITEALNLAFHGQREAPADPPENPPQAAVTWWKRLARRLFGRDSSPASSGA